MTYRPSQCVCTLVFCFLLLLPATSVRAGAGEKVIVIGAGLSGLNSALLLEEQGFVVTVLEARQRVGGRLYTLDDVPGRPEAGGNVIGPNYARVLDRARGLGLELVPAPEIAGGSANMQLYVDGTFISSKDWPDAGKNPFPERFKAVPPGTALFAAIRQNPLEQPEDWLLPAHKQSDTGVSRLFSELGFEDGAQALVSNNNSYGATLGETNLLQLYHIGAVYARSRSIPGGLMAISGGNQRLPEAMAAELHGSVLTGKVVKSITRDNKGVLVRCADGSEYKASYAIATVPFAALRNIDIHPSLPEAQARAIARLNYAQTMIAHFSVLAPYWGEHTPSLWTDTRVGRLFATAAGEGEEVTNLTLWITGRNAMYFGAMKPAQRNQALQEALYAIYPAAKGAVRLETVVDWGADPYSGGVWAAWLPGQITDFIHVMARPAGRLYFAGEHTAVTNTGMEGAMESAERAVAELLQSRNEYAGDSLFIQCQGCHSVKQGEAHKLGPNLAGFYGQEAASRGGYDYSEALSSSGLRWDREQLRRWLQGPQAMVPGNRMLYRNAFDESELEELLDYLAELDGAGMTAQ